ncbi:MAG TPA: hypothetical protein VIH00_03110 [Candidatus Limnocylindrales bacterium]
MNAYAILVVNEHLDSLRVEAAQRRALQAGPTGLRQRIASAANAIRSAIAAPAATRSQVSPTN